MGSSALANIARVSCTVITSLAEGRGSAGGGRHTATWSGLVLLASSMRLHTSSLEEPRDWLLGGGLLGC